MSGYKRASRRRHWLSSMSTVAINQNHSSVASVIGGALTAHLPQSFSEILLQINIPDFESSLRLPIIEQQSEMESGKITLIAAVDTDSTIALTLVGELFKKNDGELFEFEEDDEFQIRQINWNIETATKDARSSFINASLKAMLFLAEHVHLQIPELELDLILNFKEPPHRHATHRRQRRHLRRHARIDRRWS